MKKSDWDELDQMCSFLPPGFQQQNLPVPQNNMIMQPAPMMGFQDMFRQMMVPQVKRISPDANMITRKFHKWAMKDHADIANYEATIMEQQYKSFNFMLDVMRRMATYSEEIRMYYLQNEHMRAMWSLAEKKEQAVIMGIMLDNEVKKGIISKMKVEDELMLADKELKLIQVEQGKMELKLSDLEFQIKAKEMESFLNGRQL